MPNVPITLAAMRQQSTRQSFERGQVYYRAGAVVALTQRGQQIQALVEGNDPSPYQVTVDFDAGGITDMHCTCAYCFVGWCKHQIAVLLACYHDPDTIERRPTLDQQLDCLDLGQTRQLLQAIVAEHPQWINDVERQITLLSAVSVAPAEAAPSAHPQRRPPVDPAPFRRRVRQVIQDAVNYWESGYDDDPVAENLLDIVAETEAFVEAGDGENARAILAAITEGCVENWQDVDDYGAEGTEVAAALDAAWAASILTTEIPPEEKQYLRSQLQGWQDQWHYALPMSLEALRQGWIYPPLVRVLQGRSLSSSAWEGEAPAFADDLTCIRLAILDRQGRYQEYLYLAEAEGQTGPYLTMLARLGRVEEVMATAPNLLDSADDAFALAQLLRQQGSIDQAIAIARIGLTRPGQRLYDLATWTGDLAEALGQADLARTTRIAAFKTQPSFQGYRAIQTLAAEDWQDLKPDLLEALHHATAWDICATKVDIFLHEGLLDDAIAAVDGLSYYQEALIRRVMVAALTERPDWVIANARRRAEEIMDRGKANAYHHAVNWLARAKAAYIAADRQSEWLAYYHHLTTTHSRKYKLMGLLHQL